MPASRLTFLKLLEFFNIYPYLAWTRDYSRSSGLSLRDYALQLGFSVLGIAAAVFFVTEGMQQIVGTPLITASTMVRPSPADVLALFARLEQGEVSTVNCPCSQPVAPLAQVSNWSAPEDAFCAGMRGSLQAQPPLPPFSFNDLLALLGDASNSNCIAEPNPTPGASAVWDAFLANVTALIAPGGIFSLLSPENQALETYNLAVQMQRGLCGAAFGTIPPTSFQRANPMGRTAFSNLCDSSTNTERSFLAPDSVLRSSSPERFVQIQQSRAFTFFRSAAATCNSLNSLRAEFQQAVSTLLLTSPAALSPPGLAQAVEQLWFSALQERGRQTSAFVPGFNVEDRLAGTTDPVNLLDALEIAVSPATALDVQEFPFSSRLPFARADFMEGGTRTFFVTATANQAAFPAQVRPRYVAMAGECRVIAHTDDLGSFPFSQVQLNQRGTPNRVTPGFVPGVSQGWVPIGDDFISLLDACTSGTPLSVDVHNLRPVSWLVTAGGALQPPASNLDLPFEAVQLGPTPGLGVDNPVGRCAMGSAPPAAPAAGAPQGAQAVSFSAPLRCPGLIQWMGALRANSTYKTAANSAARFSIAQYSALFPPGAPSAALTPQQAALLGELTQGDLGERSALLSTLQIPQSGPTFSHSALRHYAACAPYKCTYTVISDRTAFQYVVEGLSILGGTASAVIGALALVVDRLSPRYSLSPHLFPYLLTPHHIPRAPPPPFPTTHAAGSFGSFRALLRSAQVR